MGQKTCLLMAAAASLELCRRSLLSDQVRLRLSPTFSKLVIHMDGNLPRAAENRGD